MNLDEPSSFAQIDTKNLLADIDTLPDQLERAWQSAQSQPLPEWQGIRQVLIAGMGASGTAAELLAAYIEPTCQVSVTVWRDYALPAWAKGEATLLILISYSGNTEETLSSYANGITHGCRILAITSGGKLAEEVQKNGGTVCTYTHTSPLHAAIGFGFGFALATLARLKLIPVPASEIVEAVQTMRAQQLSLRAESAVCKNPAKRLAGQFMGRRVMLFGAEFLAPAARRWKQQINELAQACAEFELLPEADHNALAGLCNPEGDVYHSFTLFLRSSLYQPRNLKRTNLTKHIYMLEGANTDFYDAQGNTSLAQQWTAVHFGDYCAYYLALLYECDPSNVALVRAFKAELEESN
ncbi:MAG: bifunctional phosphoglucose/phosphomannose isomerase [Chloroflexota bacterium]